MNENHEEKATKEEEETHEDPEEVPSWVSLGLDPRILAGIGFLIFVF